MNPVAEDILMHYGMPRRSGRYPWGSGEDPYQHARDFLGRVEDLRKENFTFTDEKGKTWTGDTAIAKSMGLSTNQFRTELGLAKNERRAYNVARAKSLREDGLNNSEIGRKMGVRESTVRSWFDGESEARMNKAQEIADRIRTEVDKKGMVDVGRGVERELRISKEKLDQAIYILEREGYVTYEGGIPQVTNPGQQTTQKVLCKPGTEHKEIYNYDKVHSLKDYISRDGGETLEKKFTYPSSMDSKRLQICYKEDGGIDKDGIVELRRGVADLSLGESRYSQVRILVDGTHYIKGMAVYSDDLPPGVDVRFNTNKTKDVPMHKVLKEIKADPDNPFGSSIKDADQGGQYWYNSKTGERCKSSDPDAKLGLINKRADQGDWSEWKDKLPSQFLGKQSKAMAEKQLGLARADKEAEFEAICALNNPTIKRHLLQKFADSCDSAAVDLKAAALPGQKYHVIVPINTLKDNEIYAPQYEPGTKLALVRYPHGGTFEIPIVTVNNKNSLAREILGTDAGDAVGVTSKIAQQLSGADFDGDTVMCIPTHDARGRVKISSKPYFDDLLDFDNKAQYGYDDFKEDADGTKHYYRNGKEFEPMTKVGTQQQMGVISNLLTDMTLAGATEPELIAATKHSMVVIDAEKHKLDYKQSAIDNNISALHLKYQGKSTGGASTILSKSSGEYTIEKRKGSPKINYKGAKWYDPNRPEGALIYDKADDLYYPERVSYDKNTGIKTMRTADGKRISYNIKDAADRERYEPVKKVDEDGTVRYTNKAGDIEYRVKTRTQASTKMAETDDAYSLVSPAKHPMELVYANHANSMKALANKARLEQVRTGNLKYDKNAAKVYAEEVSSLNSKLNDALLNATRERQAQRMANAEIQAKDKAGVFEDKKSKKKASQQALSKYRDKVGSISRRDRNIDITDREWEAIQAGAISDNQLMKILANTDTDKIRQYATPKATTTLSSAQINRIKAYRNSNYTIEEIAKKMGKSPSTIQKYLKGA